MSSSSAIKVDNISKMFQLYHQPQDRLKQSIYPKVQQLVGIPRKTYFREFWALRDISFEIEKGETVGIIGRNGSGKSTLLQIICGTLTPTTGTVFVDGRLTALLELGSGFNPEFTGRENVYLSGSILGFSKEEMDGWFDDIAAFADIGEFIDQQVKFYSSGMYVRLAFATNIMVRPDIMIIDEALAVGDMQFQIRCMSALKRKQEAGATIFFVSHDVNAVKSLCSRAIYLDGGELREIGSAADVANTYFKNIRKEIDAELSQTKRAQSALLAPSVAPVNELQDMVIKKENVQLPDEEYLLNFERTANLFRIGTGGARILYAELLDETQDNLTLVEFNQPVWIRIWVEGLEEKQLTVNFYILDDKKIPITGSNLSLSNHPLLRVNKGDRFMIEYKLLALPMQEGVYSLNVSLIEPILATVSSPPIFIDYIENAVVFNMAPRKPDRIWAKIFLFPSVEVVKF